MVIKLLTILIVTALLISAVNVLFGKIIKTAKNTSVVFLKNCMVIFITAIGVFVALSQLDVTRDISKTLLQGSSILIAVLTFAAQKVLGNIISGFALTTVKPFDIDDKITLMSTGGTPVVEGVVIDVNTRHTTIKQIDGKCAMVPNTVLDEMIVINNHTLQKNGFPFPMWCTFDSDVDLAMKIMQEEIEKNPLTINDDAHVTKVLCAELGDDGFRLQAIVWTNTLEDNFAACSQLRLAIFKEWKKNGIELPYKTFTILNNDNVSDN